MAKSGKTTTQKPAQPGKNGRTSATGTAVRNNPDRTQQERGGAPTKAAEGVIRNT